jgi:hypothetical protein
MNSCRKKDKSGARDVGLPPSRNTLQTVAVWLASPAAFWLLSLCVLICLLYVDCGA